MSLVADSTISTDALDGVRAMLRLEWEDLAAIIGVDQSTLYRWRHHTAAPRPIYLSRLEEIGEVVALLPLLAAA